MSEKPKREFSKVVTSIVVGLFSFVAVAFIAFVCYEMHRLEDLSPVGYIGVPIVGLLATVLGIYSSRAKAKSKTDLQWEQTKQLTLFREKHPEYFVRAGDPYSDTESISDEFSGGVG